MPEAVVSIGFHRLEQNTICKGYQFHDANLQYDV